MSLNPYKNKQVHMHSVCLNFPLILSQVRAHRRPTMGVPGLLKLFLEKCGCVQ